MIKEISEQELQRTANRALIAGVLTTLLGAFFVSMLGGPAAGITAAVMAVGVGAASVTAGAAVALRGAITRAKKELS